MSKGLGIRERQVLQVLAKREIIIPGIMLIHKREYFFEPERLKSKGNPFKQAECEVSAIRRACESLCKKGILEKGEVEFRGKVRIGYRMKRNEVIKL